MAIRLRRLYWTGRASRLGGSRRRSVGANPFGLSWAPAVSLRNPPFGGIGFPWISLDSLVRIVTYQWVTRDFPRRKFLVPFPSASRRCDGGSRFRDAEGRGRSWAKAYRSFRFSASNCRLLCRHLSVGLFRLRRRPLRPGRARPGHPRGATPKTPQASARPTAKAYKHKAFHPFCAPAWTRCAEPRGWPGQARP